MRPKVLLLFGVLHFGTVHDVHTERRGSDVLAVGNLVLKGGRCALSDDFALPLADAGDHIEAQAARRGRGVEAVFHREKVEAVREVSLEQLTEVLDTTGEAVELGDDQAFGCAGFQSSEGVLQAFAFEVLGGSSSVDKDFHEVVFVESAELLELGALCGERNAVGGLFVGADPDVSDNVLHEFTISHSGYHYNRKPLK